MKKQFFRICSTVLIIVLLINMLPMSIFAEEFREYLTTETIQPDTQPELTAKSDAHIVGEIPSKRTQYTKEFMLSNGLHLAVVYPDAVHYEADDGWEEIDNTLTLKNGKYVNTAGVWNVRFPQQLSDSKSVTIEKDGYTLSFAMAGELRSTGLEIAGTIGGEDALSINESLMQVLEDPMPELPIEAEATSPTMETTALEKVPEETEIQETIVPEETVPAEETEPEETMVETVPETTVEVMETEPEITEPLPEATVPTEVETEQIITETIPEQLSVSKMQLSTAAVQPLDKAALQDSYQYPEMAPDKLYSRLSYANVYQNTDIIYDMDSNRVKESIVMESYSNTLRGYKYTLNVGQLIPVLEEDGQILFYDADQKNVVMVMPAPYLVDAAEESNWDVRVQLTGSNGIYTLTYLLPTQWLADAERAWPVILDPVVEANLERSNIRDVTVSSIKTYDNNWGMNSCGWRSKDGITRTYLKYAELPALTSSDVVVSAGFGMYRYAGSTNATTVEVHKVYGTWESEDLTWEDQDGLSDNEAYEITFDPKVEDYAIVNDYVGYSWDVTDIVQSWYESGNTGMMFKAPDSVEQGSTKSFKQFVSADFGTEDYRPTLLVEFRNNNGLESLWDYTGSSAGRAGTGYINNYTGNLTWIREDLYFEGNRMPVRIQHVYNLNDAIVPSDNNNSNDSGGNSFGMGYGWRTNYNQLVYQWNVDSSYYVWEDADGTDHYFQYDEDTGKYENVDGLEMTLTDTGSGTTKYCITDKDGNRSYFDTYGRLRKQENNQQTKSSINITYYSTTRLITCITDGIGRRYLYMYENGLLDRIEYMGSGSTVLSCVEYSYGYENSKYRLETVKYKDGKVCAYEYNEKGLLLSAQDIDGYKLTYNYNTVADRWQPYRVLNVEESDGDAKAGKLTFAYGHNQTTITDHNGNTEIHQFNDWGNTVSIQDNEGHATFADYARNDKDDTGGKANQLKVSSKLQNTVGNRLAASNFEKSNVWYTNSASLTATRTTEAAYSGSYSLKLTSSASSTTAGLTEGFYVDPNETYIFSAYVKTVDAYAIIALQYGATYTTYTGSHLSPNRDWTRLEAVYTNQSEETRKITPILFLTTSGTAYMDCVQVEKAPTPSRYNLVENGDFRHSGSPAHGWTNPGLASSDGLVTVDTSAAPQLENTVLKITGNPSGYKQLVQYIDIGGSTGDSYVISGWAKGNSVPLGNIGGREREFEIEVTLHHYDDTITRGTAKFNPDSDQWQYSAGVIVAQKSYHSMAVVIRYNFNANTVYFDGIQLYKEEFGSSYTYDEDGNVTSVVDLQKKNTTYEYNSNGDITRILEDNVAKMTYTYDSWRNVKTATTDAGVVYSFTYDTYGNNTKVSIGSGNKTISSRAQYTTDGNRLLYTWDALDKKTSYGYNENTGMLDWVQYPEDTTATRTEYEYDTMYRMAKAECTTDTGNHMYAQYIYTNDYLTKIQTPTTTYDFNYGDFGLRENVKIGNIALATYSYTNDRNRYLQSLTYGNADNVEYTYDNKGRLLTQTYEDGDTVSYTYDNNGALAKVKDSATGRTTTYYYDLTDRMMKYVEKGTDFSHSVGYEYDTKNNLTQLVEEINGTKHTASYTYDDDNRIETVTTDGATVTYTYDTWGRLHTKVTKNSSGASVLTEEYTYVKPTINGVTAESTQIAQYKVISGSTVITYNYTYDDNGNILSINEGANTTSYVYDSANQLIRENNQAGGFTNTWEYDAGGNILSRKDYAYTIGSLNSPTNIDTYSYQTNTWGDIQTRRNNGFVSYDSIGNPLSDNIFSYTWEHGRQLATLTLGGVTWTYQYNSDGMRIGRAPENGYASYEYVYNGDQLVQMETRGYTVNFTYDTSGHPTTMQYRNSVLYYITNIQGDVIGLSDRNGNVLVRYTYDAWGNAVDISGNQTIISLNPFRYRGYVYDQETGLYCLQSRYYDPEMGRFLNADAFPTTGQGFVGNNMFAYCLNNPIIYKDDCGHAAMLLLDKDTVGHIGALVQDEAGDWWHFYWGTDGWGPRALCSLGVPVTPTSWCVEYTGETTLEQINNAAQFGGEYEESIYLSGDFSDCVDKMKNPTGRYNLYTNNCSQKTLSILSTAKTSHSNSLLKAAKQVVPVVAFNNLKMNMLIDSGNIATYVGRVLERIIPWRYR